MASEMHWFLLNMGNTGPKSKTEKSRVRGQARVRSQGLTQAITKVKRVSSGVKGCWGPKPGMSSYIPSSKKEGEQGPGDFCVYFLSTKMQVHRNQTSCSLLVLFLVSWFVLLFVLLTWATNWHTHRVRVTPISRMVTICVPISCVFFL